MLFASNLIGVEIMRFVRIAFVVSVALAISHAQERNQDIQITGVVGQHVVIKCDLPLSSPPVVRWIDRVFNDDENAKVIFSTENNPSFSIREDHGNKDNFAIGRDFTLTASKLMMDAGPGQYTCTSVVGGETHNKSYYLTVRGSDFPKCNGTVQLNEGASTYLTCQMQYSGTRVVLQWFRGNQSIRSNDKNEINHAKMSLDIESVTYENDQEKYTCLMVIGDVRKECSLTLSVQYFVRDLVISPDEDSVRVGEALHCSAKGNPLPQITLESSLKTQQVSSGDSSSEIVMQPDWLGNQVTVTCSAKNTISGRTETLFRNHTVTVTKGLVPTSKTSAITDNSNMIGVIVGLVIALVILACIVIAVICIRRQKSIQKPPKGAKPLPTKEEITYGQNGQNGQHGQAV